MKNKPQPAAPKVNMKDKTALFKKELHERIAHYFKKRRGDRARAFWLKIVAVIFAALITMLLGVKVDSTLEKIFQNAALILGAAISILNAVDAFYDHRALWIRRTVTLARLYELERDFSQYVAGHESEQLDPKEFEKLTERYDRIMADDLKAWLKLREENAATHDSAKKAGIKDA